uniref:F-box domain-containing protein n=1 Tax=Panagrellus redivivus TaxID=6233 RepID=A0A7E4VXV4_PANRE
MLDHLDIHNLANTDRRFLLRLIEVMPLETLYHARHANDDIKRYSDHRGDIVDSLLVKRGNPLDEGYITYSQMINRPRKLTPFNHLSIHMRPGFDPKALVAKMDTQIYRTLNIYGSYHWQQVFHFLHFDLATVKLFGKMKMNKAWEAKYLFAAIAHYEVQEFSLLTDGALCWNHEAFDTWKDLRFCRDLSDVYKCTTECYLRVTGVLADGAKLRMRIKNYVDEPDDDVNLERPESDPEDSDDEPDRCRNVRLKCLKVKSANCQDNDFNDYLSYAEVIDRPYKTTPSFRLHVYMGADINPTALVAKMEKQVYHSLFIYGDYHWRQVVTLLRVGLKIAKLSGRMQCETEREAKDFFLAIAGYRVRKFVILTENWAWNTHAGRIWANCSCFTSTHSNPRGRYYRLTGVIDGIELRLKIKYQHDQNESSDGSDDDSICSIGSFCDNINIIKRGGFDNYYVAKPRINYKKEWNDNSGSRDDFEDESETETSDEEAAKSEDEAEHEESED